MAKKYDYHKHNDYPGERIAERKRVDDRAEATDKKSYARVAEKVRTAGQLVDVDTVKASTWRAIRQRNLLKNLSIKSRC